MLRRYSLNLSPESSRCQPDLWRLLPLWLLLLPALWRLSRYYRHWLPLSSLYLPDWSQLWRLLMRLMQNLMLLLLKNRR